MNRRIRSIAVCVAACGALLAGACNDSPTSGRVQEKIGSPGGRIELAHVARFDFPAGFFPDPRTVSLAKVNDTAAVAAFDEFAGLFRATGAMTYQVRLLAGRSLPADGTFAAVIPLPAGFAVPDGASPELFARVYEDVGGEVLDNFQLFPAFYDPAANALQAVLPSWVFTTSRRADGQSEAIFIVAATPGPGSRLGTGTGAALRSRLRAAAATGPLDCKGVTLGRPVDESFRVTDGFGERIHPVLGVKKMHWGTDFAVPSKTPVRSAADGTIERVNNDAARDAGRYIVVRHADGSATDYFHLESSSVTVGQKVERGQVIGMSDNTGRSTGAHLHMEYVPNGEIILSKNRIDPLPCMQESPNSSIMVGDNGSAADDAFAVYLDNRHLGTTVVGKTNTFNVNNLIPGPHQLRIVGVTVPDNAGTWEIVLANGVTFSDGTTRKSDVMPTGGSVTFTIIVPKVSVRTAPVRQLSRPNAFREPASP